jgi:hypothetical protein
MEKIKVGSELYIISPIAPYPTDTRRFHVGDKVVVTQIEIEPGHWLWLGIEGSLDGYSNWAISTFSRTQGGTPLRDHEIEGYGEKAKMKKRVIRD